jgi:bacterioferritin-associated ferredoxin
MNTSSLPETCLDCAHQVVCRCLHVTAIELIDVMTTQDIRSLKDLRRHTGAGDGCTACHHQLRKYLERYGYSSSDSPICSVK